MHPEEQGVIEIRRGEGGIRAWAAEPGEYYNAFDGEYGGLWRRNGRPPQQTAGIGFSAQGTFLDPITGALSLPLNVDFLGFLKVLTISDLEILGFLEVVLQDSNWTGPMLD